MKRVPTWLLLLLEPFGRWGVSRELGARNWKGGYVCREAYRARHGAV